MDNPDSQHILAGIQSVDCQNNLAGTRMIKRHFVLCIQCLVHIVMNHNRLVNLVLVKLAANNVQMDFHKVLLDMNKSDYDSQLYTKRIARTFQRMDLNNVDLNKLD